MFLDTEAGTVHFANQTCQHRGRATARTTTADGKPVTFFGCDLETVCTLEDFGQVGTDGDLIAVCATCRRQNEPIPPKIERKGFGDHLEDILKESWIDKPCGSCSTFRDWMNGLTLAEINQPANRETILDRLRQQSDEYAATFNPVPWIKMAAMRLRGFRDVGDILDEAIRRGSLSDGPTQSPV